MSAERNPGSRGPAKDYIDIGEKRGSRVRAIVESALRAARKKAREEEEKMRALGVCEARLDTSQSASVWL